MKKTPEALLLRAFLFVVFQMPQCFRINPPSVKRISGVKKYVAPICVFAARCVTMKGLLKWSDEEICKNPSP
jgi:hypothetical protein